MTDRVPARRRQAKKKPSERVAFLVVRKLMDPETGEEFRCFVAAAPIDRAILAERQYKIGDVIAADLFKERNARFHRLAHQLCTFLRKNVERFHGWTSHAVLKKLQLEANIECDVEEFEILGEKVERRIPRSINFTDMDDAVFAVLWDSICEHVAATYFPGWTQAQIADASAHWERDQC